MYKQILYRVINRALNLSHTLFPSRLSDFDELF